MATCVFVCFFIGARICCLIHRSIRYLLDTLSFAPLLLKSHPLLLLLAAPVIMATDARQTLLGAGPSQFNLAAVSAYLASHTLCATMLCQMSHPAQITTCATLTRCAWAGQVRARAQELKTSLEEVVRALATNAHMLNWEVVLKKFTTINLQASGIMN